MEILLQHDRSVAMMLGVEHERVALKTDDQDLVRHCHNVFYKCFNKQNYTIEVKTFSYKFSCWINILASPTGREEFDMQQIMFMCANKQIDACLLRALLKKEWMRDAFYKIKEVSRICREQKDTLLKEAFQELDKQYEQHKATINHLRAEECSKAMLTEAASAKLQLFSDAYHVSSGIYEKFEKERLGVLFGDHLSSKNSKDSHKANIVYSALMQLNSGSWYHGTREMSDVSVISHIKDFFYRYNNCMLGYAKWGPWRKPILGLPCFEENVRAVMQQEEQLAWDYLWLSHYVVSRKYHWVEEEMSLAKGGPLAFLYVVPTTETIARLIVLQEAVQQIIAMSLPMFEDASSYYGYWDYDNPFAHLHLKLRTGIRIVSSTRLHDCLKRYMAFHQVRERLLSWRLEHNFIDSTFKHMVRFMAYHEIGTIMTHRQHREKWKPPSTLPTWVDEADQLS